ncbi:MAG: hypothetical protein C0592_08965 [Marinilabiliales bacterium]|nr:MAG: hypothetical protein C0592_08965 [Marinilabiliales bacterium]
MKKLYVLFAFMMVSSFAFSQIANDKAVISKKMQVPAHMMTKTPTDTCGWSLNFIPEFAVSGQVYVYTYTGGGYVFGNNVDGVDGSGQGYVYTGSLGIEGTLLWFAEKYESGSNSSMTVTAYALDGLATNDPSNTVGPGTALGAAATLTMSQVDTVWPNWTWVPFASVLPSTGDFAVCVDFSALTANSDTAGLLCDEDGDASQLDYAFSQYMGTWYVTDYAFGGLDVNVAIFPVVDINYVGINDDHYFYGMQSNAYPNPASSNMTIEYALENNANVEIEIVASNGATIDVIEQGDMSAGTHSVSYNVSNLQSGHYFFSIHANGHRLIKSFIVE